MKTTIVPAQITTVEDRIAGNLTFPQIILLVISLIAGAGIYGGVGPALHLSDLKLALIILQFIIFGTLSLRISGKIVADWLIIYLRFKSRPKRYIFTKNDPAGRDIIIEKDESVELVTEQTIDLKLKQVSPLTLPEQIKLDQLFTSEATSVSFKLSKKGGVDVCFKQAQN